MSHAILNGIEAVSLSDRFTGIGFTASIDNRMGMILR